MFQKAKKFLKLFISLSLLLIVLFFGSLGFLAFGKVYLPEEFLYANQYLLGIVGDDQYPTNGWLSPETLASGLNFLCLYLKLNYKSLLTVHGRGGTSTMELTGVYRSSFSCIQSSWRNQRFQKLSRLSVRHLNVSQIIS